jgi:hypothetical protein
MSNKSHPIDQDPVLGGSAPPPSSSVVLGGIVGLTQRFEQADLKQRLAALVDAAHYGEAGIDLLKRGLQDQNLQMRLEAYLQLKVLANTSTRLPGIPELGRGVPLRVGDRLYAVYASRVCYDDSFYYVKRRADDVYHRYHPLYISLKDPQGNVFQAVSDVSDREYDEIQLISYYCDRTTAEGIAEITHQHTFHAKSLQLSQIRRWNFPGDDSEYENWEYGTLPYSDQVVMVNTLLKPWVEEKGIILENILKDWDDDEYTYEAKVVLTLEKQKQVDLLQEMWSLMSYPRFAFVQEYVIDRSCYLRLQAIEF